MNHNDKNNKITILHWNSGFGSERDKIAECISEYMSGRFIIVLQEIIPSKYEYYKTRFSDTCQLIYSLDYRKPGKYDSRSRQLGILMIIPKEYDLIDSGVFTRTLYPDRTLYAELKDGSNKLKIAAFHSITGCDHKKSKSDHFLSCAEAVDEFRPDIVTTDANEPDIDFYSIEGMTFYDKNGSGARTFFEAMENNGLCDSYAINYDMNNYTDGEPLTVSHVIKSTKKKKRYDFVFINKDRFTDIRADYSYEKAVAATGDHAIVVVSAADINKSIG